MPEHPRDHHATPLTVEEHARAVSCTRCPARAELAACWMFDGRRRQVVCRQCATRWAAPLGVPLPEPGAGLLPARERRRLVGPSLPHRESRPVHLRLAVETVLEEVEEQRAPEPEPDTEDGELAVRTLRLIADGRTDAQITRRLAVSDSAARAAIRAAVDSMCATGRVHAVHMGHQAGILCSPAIDAAPAIGAREQYVLEQIAAGRDSKQIAALMRKSHSTVSGMTRTLSRALGGGLRARIVDEAHRVGLLPCQCTAQRAADGVREAARVLADPAGVAR